jgi:ADP-ribosylglycohydrolase
LSSRVKWHLGFVELLGSIVGDIVGSAYEFSRYKGKTFDPLFHPKARFTDDTICTVAVEDAILRGVDPQSTTID